MNFLGQFLALIITTVIEPADSHGIPDEILVWRDKSGPHHMSSFDFLVIMGSCTSNHPYQHYCLRAIVPWRIVVQTLPPYL